MIDPSTQLDYVKTPPLHRSARVRRWMVTAGFAALLMVALWLVPRSYRHVQLLKWQERCLTYAAPATEPVYDNDPAEAKRLLTLPRTYLADPRDGATFRLPIEWIQFYMAAGFGPQSSGTVFLHQRSTPRGQRRLVAIDLVFNPLSHERIITMSERVLVPATPLRGPRAEPSTIRGDGLLIPVSPTDRLRVFAGQPDPNDASHFTIEYDLNGTRHVLDGWLVDEATIKIEERN